MLICNILINSINAFRFNYVVVILNNKRYENAENFNNK